MHLLRLAAMRKINCQADIFNQFPNIMLRVMSRISGCDTLPSCTLVFDRDDGNQRSNRSPLRTCPKGNHSKPNFISSIKIHANERPCQEHDIKTLFGRKVAIDASMSIYQFLIAVRQKDGEMLTNDAGETTRSVCSVLYFENSQELEALTRPVI